MSERTEKVRKPRITYAASKNINGFLYILPWILGFVVFFAIPLKNTIVYSFNKVEVKQEGGIALTFNGLQNYIDLFRSEVTTQSQPITRLFVDENTTMLINLPLIVIFSLFLAILANAKFPGRGFVRVIFFMPIILGLQLIVDWAANSAGREMIESAAGSLNSSMIGAGFLFDYTFLPPDVILFLTGIINDIFPLISRTGVQTMIFLAGLQSISPSHYEVAKIEGANSYEVFWKVTLPLLANVTVFVIIYTLIDIFLGSSIAEEVYEFAFAKSKIGIGSALSTMYILNVLVALGAVMLLLKAVKIVDSK